MDTSRGRGYPLRRGSTHEPRSRRATTEEPDVFAPDKPAIVDQRIMDIGRGHGSLVSMMRSLSVRSESDSPRYGLDRPGYGTKGSPIVVRTNLLEVKIPRQLLLYDYTITFEPKLRSGNPDLSKRLLEEFDNSSRVQKLRKQVKFVHDGASRLVSMKKFDDFNVVAVVLVDIDETRAKREEFKIHVRLGKRSESKSDKGETNLSDGKLEVADLFKYLSGEKPNFNPQRIISALNLILHYSSKGQTIRNKNSFYFPSSRLVPPEQPVRPFKGAELLKGFHSTIIPVERSLMVNVNPCMSAFYVAETTLSDALLAYRSECNGPYIPRKFYERLRVVTTHLGYTKHSYVKELGPNSSENTEITDERGRRVTVKLYFEEKYSKVLKHPDLPVANIGGPKRDIFVPPEFCTIHRDQAYSNALSPRQAADMARYWRKSPRSLAEMICGQGIQTLGLKGSDSLLSSFEMRCASEMSVVPARILESPRVLYREGTIAPTVRNGTWSSLGTKFAVPAELGRIAVLVLYEEDKTDFNGLINTFFEVCLEFGMKISETPKPPVFIKLSHNHTKVLSDVRDIMSEEALGIRPKLTLVFLPKKDDDIYSGIRRIFDLELGLQSIFLRTSKAQLHQSHYFKNVTMKLNAKLGGISHRLHSDSKSWLGNTMLVGMCLLHPGADEIKGTPSISSMTASCDSEFMLYPMNISFQKSGESGIADIKSMLIQRLKVYHRQNGGRFPKRIIFFRVGSHDGTGKFVLKNEVPAIEEAFENMPGERPKITIVLCGRTRHRRFFATSPADADLSSNLKAGTVVDQGVGNVHAFDFFLQAHAAPVSKSDKSSLVRSARYTVIHDENNFSADDLQQGFNDMSYLWARATQSVSLIPPAYWAIHACRRGRVYLHGICNRFKGGKEVEMTSSEVTRKVERMWGSGIHRNLENTMFYV